ncbi:hypothetical protein [Deinococcus soli (ex Cha et al. 2016)]|uniref:hypothetical protein n=1 Tax=Deinococcus soli (ex Cha et al. 2016) TaxID=1309411 RepID=UPI001667DF16|nr:hypothetical protein [Deinococcus soli (ex Cha et al. 2016)]GGB79311.1 hypothetical protein GCM10008019_39400 [Deinococcus soli (ex Cha et al. 2016)]
MIDLDALTALTPQQRLARYQVLRELLAPLEAEKDALNALIKADLQAGETVETAELRAVLKTSHSTTYPIEAFVAAFGPDQALAVASIDAKKVQARVKQRELAAGEVKEIAVVTPRSTALVIEPIRAA